MTRLLLLALYLFIACPLLAQVRVSKLVIKANETYELKQSDIIVADTLILMDSAKLVLNKLKQENYIRAQYAVFGDNCIIDGKGLDGKPGRNGKQGNTPFGPCSDGSSGRSGGKGLDGTAGVNLFLYLDEVNIKGRLIINLSGGNGGQGGDGGNGGGGSPGTVHCNGGNGGYGGNAGQGGNGANGGQLTISSKKNPGLRQLIGDKIKIHNYGGFAGPQGRAGYRGPAGLGPSKKNGKDGEPGQDAPNGQAGQKGEVNFESN